MRKKKDKFLVTIESEQKGDKSEKSIFFFFLSFFFIFTLALGTNYGLGSILSFTISGRTILEICLYSSLWSVIIFSILSYKKIGLIITGFGILIYGIVYKEDILVGLQIFINHFIEKINIYYRARFTYFIIEGEVEGPVIYIWGVLIFLFTIVCGYFFIKRRRTNIILTCSLAVMIIGFLLGNIISSGSLFLLAGITLCSFYLEKNHYIGKTKSVKATLLSICMITAVFLVFILAGKFFVEPRIKEPLREWNETLYRWDSKVGQNIASSPLYKKVNTSLNRIFYRKSSGMLTNQEPEHTGKKVLSITVKAENMLEQNLYLKGWVGSTYQDGHWSDLSEENFYNAAKEWKIKTKTDIGLSIQNLLYEHLKEFPLNNNKYDKQHITIEHLEELPYKYVPYGIKFEENVVPFGDGYIKKDKKKYNSYDGYFIYKDFIYYKLLSMSVEKQKNPLVILWNQKEFGEADVLEYFRRGKSNIYDADEDGNLFVPKDKIIPKVVKKIEDKYGSYVKNEYTKIPKEGLEKLKKLCNDETFNEVWEAKEFITDYLHNNTVYSTNLKPLSYGEDFVEHFLYKEKKGFCTHYATTATLMFRMLGFPARYVSGYVVTPSLFEKSGEEYISAKIPDSNAHAWTEVYIDGKGWVPIEVTPGYDIIQEMVLKDSNIKFNEILPTKKPSEEKEKDTANKKEEKKQKEETKGNSDKEAEIWDLTLDIIFMQWLNRIFWIFGAIIILICSFLVRRKILLYKREQRLEQTDNNIAVKEISYEMHRILIYSGYKKEKYISDEEYGDYIGRLLDYWNKDEYCQFLIIVRKACFSLIDISEEEKAYCLKVYNKVLKNEKKKKSGIEAMFWKYILCY